MSVDHVTTDDAFVSFEVDLRIYKRQHGVEIAAIKGVSSFGARFAHTTLCAAESSPAAAHATNRALGRAPLSVLSAAHPGPSTRLRTTLTSTLSTFSQPPPTTPTPTARRLRGPLLAVQVLASALTISRRESCRRRASRSAPPRRCSPSRFLLDPHATRPVTPAPSSSAGSTLTLSNISTQSSRQRAVRPLAMNRGPGHRSHFNRLVSRHRPVEVFELTHQPPSRCKRIGGSSEQSPTFSFDIAHAVSRGLGEGAEGELPAQKTAV